MNKVKSQMFGSDPDSLGALSMKPVKRYSAPGYPTYSVASGNPALLEKLPSRWQDNAKVIACIGVFGTAAMVGCDGNPRNVDTTKGNTPTDIVTNVIGENDARVRISFDESGWAEYTVHLSEQEIRSIRLEEPSAISEEAKAVGLTLSWAGDNTCRVYVDSEVLSSSMRYGYIGNALREKGVDDMPWREFLKYLKEQTTGDNNARVRLHHGGSSGSPFYVAYLTEQEALSAIRTEAKAAGLNIISSAEEPLFFNFSKTEDPNVSEVRGTGIERLGERRREFSNTFRENSADGMPWKEFLKLLEEQTSGENDAKVRMHNGGSGSTFYVVYLTEQEALSAIRAEAEAAGLELSEESFVERRFGMEIASHSNAFVIGRAGIGSLGGRGGGSAFREKGVNEMPWKEFLKLLEEQKEEK